MFWCLEITQIGPKLLIFCCYGVTTIWYWTVKSMEAEFKFRKTFYTNTSWHFPNKFQNCIHKELFSTIQPCIKQYNCFLFCFVLFCFLFCFCFVLFCFVLFCFVLFCFVLFCFILFLFCFIEYNYYLTLHVLYHYVLICRPTFQILNEMKWNKIKWY